MKRYIVEKDQEDRDKTGRTDSEKRVVGRLYGMKYS